MKFQWHSKNNSPTQIYSKKSLVVVLVAFVALALIYVIFHIWYFGFTKNSTEALQVVVTKSRIVPDQTVNMESDKNIADTTASTSVSSYSYLFEEKRESMTSNIVGYFAHGAFAWYVPDWVVQNWEVRDPATTSEDMIISPKVRENVTDFSDIIFTIKPSTESFNAENLYNLELNSVASSSLLINEIVLNKHTTGGITMVIETNTRIYHIEKEFQNRIMDIYYLDGKGKTLVMTFNARADIYPQFSTKIRNLIEGIGELKSPQG